MNHKKYLSSPIKQAIANAVENRRKKSDVANQFGVNKSTVGRIYKR
jgi:hypothetical protein